MTIPQVSMVALADKLPILATDEVVLDVRGRDEYAAGHVPGSRNIPHTELLAHLDELRIYKTIYIHCKSGGRATFAADFLSKTGFANLVCISGSGMTDWVAAGLPVER